MTADRHEELARRAGVTYPASRSSRQQIYISLMWPLACVRVHREGISIEPRQPLRPILPSWDLSRSHIARVEQFRWGLRIVDARPGRKAAYIYTLRPNSWAEAIMEVFEWGTRQDAHLERGRLWQGAPLSVRLYAAALFVDALLALLFAVVSIRALIGLLAANAALALVAFALMVARHRRHGHP